MALREYDYEKEPVVSIVKKVLIDAIKLKASDIHFDPTIDELSIKLRINGTLQEYTTAPEAFKSNITTRIKILSGMNITDSLRPQIGTINFDNQGKISHMRASSLPTSNGEKIVININNYKSNIKTLSKIGITPEDTQKIKTLLKSNQGIILLTGTSGSGKTTTMYAMLKEISSKSVNIISIEDPVKMKIDGIHQVEVDPDRGLTYKNAIKHTLFQDPNIICVDHLIDDEVARDIIRASITGRLIISSLYTKNAYTTIDTLLNMDIENYLLGSNINGIISQRLVKELCPNCKELKPATEYEKTVIKKISGKDITELYYPHGCHECQDGYIGQFPIVEVIEITDEIKSAITNKKDRKTIRNLLYKNNKTILVDGVNRVIEGDTSFNELIKVIDVKADFTDEEKEIKDYILGNGTPTTDNLVEVNNTIEERAPEYVEEYNVLEEIVVPPITEEQNTMNTEVNVPTPMDASIVEEEVHHYNNIEDDDDDDDDDDDFEYNGFKPIL